MAAHAPRATVRLVESCDNRCAFCATSDAAPGALAPVDLDARLDAARATSDELTFTGGEPTLHPALTAAIAAARARGFARIGLKTHARGLAARGVVDGLAAAGLTDVVVGLHAGDSAAHDYHTGVAGSFAQALAGVAAARSRGLDVAISTVVTRSNFRVLGALPRVLRARGVAAWQLALPHAGASAPAAFERLAPRLGLAMPFALHALQSARALGLPAFVSGAALCALGPLAQHALPSAPRAYAEACAACPARARCPGVDARYLARFRGDELAPRPLVPGDPLERATEAPLARMFVGVDAQCLDRDATHEPLERAPAPRRSLAVVRGEP